MASKQMTAMLLGIVLALRLVATPFIMSSPAPGIMAICSGGQVTYISMDDGQPVQDADDLGTDPCPVFGIMSVLPGIETPVAPAMKLTARKARVIHVMPSFVAQSDPLYRSRAPPLLA